MNRRGFFKGLAALTAGFTGVSCKDKDKPNMTETSAAIMVSNPVTPFTTSRSFKACSNGKVFIGQPDTDPTLPENQIPVYVENECGKIVQVPQPIMINAAGYPVYHGQLAKFVTTKNHSMAVYDSHMVQQFYWADLSMIDPNVFHSSSGFGYIGQVTSFADLRNITPSSARQSILLQSHQSGAAAQSQPYGGDIFDAINQNLSDDGGFVAQVSNSWAWVRRKQKHDATVLDFGALPGASNDIAPAALAMHKALGFVRIPPGDYGISNISDNTISSFNFFGSLNVYGRSVVTNLYLMGSGSGTVLDMQAAQVTSIGNLNLYCNSYSGMFFDNTAKTGGKFYNLERMVIRQSANVVFNMTDTLDTSISQIYSYACAGSIVKARWSNIVSGSWDHSTAIAIRDCNFNGSTGMHALDIPRVTQGRMDNVWFQDCEKPMDISQGQWDINTLCVESPGAPIYAQYAKISLNDQDFIGDNAYLDYTKSGYESSWDDGDINNGSMPAWVASGYEMGKKISTHKAFQLEGEMAYKAQTPLYRLPDTSSDTWIYVGTVAMTTVGIAVDMVLSGSTGFNAVSSETTNPRTASVGNGTTVIRIQNKSTTDGLTVSWNNEGAGPVQDVKLTQPYNTDINIYVKLSAFTYKTGVFLRTTDFSRLEQGATFQFSPYLSVVSDITSVSGIKDAPALWAINSGQSGSGFGMDLDAGRLLYQGALDSSATKIPIYVNGSLKYISFTDS